MEVFEISLVVDDGGSSQKLAVPAANSVTSAAMPAGCTHVLFTPDVDMFVRRGLGSPVATNDGTDIFLVAGNTYRSTMPAGYMLAFRAATTDGNVYISPNE